MASGMDDQIAYQCFYCSTTDSLNNRSAFENEDDDEYEDE